MNFINSSPIVKKLLFYLFQEYEPENGQLANLAGGGEDMKLPSSMLKSVLEVCMMMSNEKNSLDMMSAMGKFCKQIQIFN